MYVIFIQVQALCSFMSVRNGDISKQAGALTSRLNSMKRSEFLIDMKSIQGVYIYICMYVCVCVHMHAYLCVCVHV